MAHTIAVTKLLDGNYRSIFHVALISDGASGELTDQVLIEPSDLGLTSSARVAIEKIEYSFINFDARLEVDYLVDDNMMWVLNRDLSCIDFFDCGGLKDPSEVDGTGKIMITTSDFGNLGAQGSMILRVRNG